MRWAYGVMDYQISASASWMSQQQFEISAKAGEAAAEPELKRMLQGLLADRFKLAFHREQKEMQALVMTVAKGGPKFKESVGEGESSLRTQNDVAIGKRASMADLAALVSGPVRSPVIDRTGLTGRYDFTIDPKPYLPADGNAGTQVDRAALVITAFQEELGLKVEAKKVSMEMLVIDRAEKPSEN